MSPSLGPQKPSPRQKEAPPDPAGAWQPRSPRPSARAVAKHRAASGARLPWWQLVGMFVLIGPLWLVYGQPLWARLVLTGVLFLAVIFGVMWAVGDCLGDLSQDIEITFEDGR